jgi:hypothetical protein
VSLGASGVPPTDRPPARLGARLLDRLVGDGDRLVTREETDELREETDRRLDERLRAVRVNRESSNLESTDTDLLRVIRESSIRESIDLDRLRRVMRE